MNNNKMANKMVNRQQSSKEKRLNSSSTAPIRLHQDYTMFMKNPDPFIKVAMNSRDIFEW